MGLLSQKEFEDMFYEDRREAAEKVLEQTKDKKIQPDTVLAVIDGGIPIGRELADRLDTEFDVTASENIRVPRKPDITIGSVAADGTLWLKEDLHETRETDRETIRELRQRAAERARKKLKRLRGEKHIELRGRSVLLVDDGITDTAEIAACVGQARKAGAEEVHVSVPVASRYAIQKLKGISDGAFSLKMPRFVDSVDDYYRKKNSTPDREASRYPA